MARLIAPNGSTVNVSAEKAKRLVAGSGFKPADNKKAPAKKAAAPKSAKADDDIK